MCIRDSIDTIFNTFKERKDVDKFAHVATFDEIQENDFNLNITRYVDTFVEEAEIDIQATIKELEALKPELARLEAQMDDYLKQLGIKS